MKHALWRELAESGFARLAATIWLLPLLQLLLRVQLNILGRQLFVESNLLEPRYLAVPQKAAVMPLKWPLLPYAEVLKVTTD